MKLIFQNFSTAKKVSKQQFTNKFGGKNGQVRTQLGNV